jgi:hypothetical protein
MVELIGCVKWVCEGDEYGAYARSCCAPNSSRGFTRGAQSSVRVAGVSLVTPVSCLVTELNKYRVIPATLPLKWAKGATVISDPGGCASCICQGFSMIILNLRQLSMIQPKSRSRCRRPESICCAHSTATPACNTPDMLMPVRKAGGAHGAASGDAGNAAAHRASTAALCGAMASSRSPENFVGASSRRARCWMRRSSR